MNLVHALDAGYNKGERDPTKGRRTLIIDQTVELAPPFDPDGSRVPEAERAYSTRGVAPAVKEMATTIYDDYNGAFTEVVGSVRSTFGNEARGNGVKIIQVNGEARSRFERVYSPDRIRRLTPTECERLQGFPDGWTAGTSDTQRYRMMGNAVTVNVIEAIGRRLFSP